eukprot:2463682-Prymnesium_polylepis.1
MPRASKPCGRVPSFDLGALAAAGASPVGGGERPPSISVEEAPAQPEPPPAHLVAHPEQYVPAHAALF